MHERMHVVGLAVELAQLSADCGADVPDEVLAGGEHLVGKHRPPVVGGEHKVSVQRIDGAGARPGVALRVGADYKATVSMGAEGSVWEPVVVGVAG